MSEDENGERVLQRESTGEEAYDGEDSMYIMTWKAS